DRRSRRHARSSRGRAGLPRVRSTDRVARRDDPPGDEPTRDPRSVRREPADRNDRRAPIRDDMTTLSPYAAVVGARFRMLLQYRAAALAGLWTQIFFGFVLLGVYEAFYSASTAQPMTFDQIVSYVWLGQALLAMLPWNSDPEWRDMVRSGSVAYE